MTGFLLAASLNPVAWLAVLVAWCGWLCWRCAREERADAERARRRADGAWERACREYEQGAEFGPFRAEAREIAGLPTASGRR